MLLPNSGSVVSHFLDSGAFTLWKRADEYAKEHRCSKWEFYDTQEHWDYLRDYATFVQKYKRGIDFYANVDVIPNGDLTYRNQKHLEEKYNLRPVPIVHYTTSLKYLKKYMDEGYDYIGLGGLVGSGRKQGCRYWIDRAFDLVCSGKDNLPCVKLHGFGVTDYSLLIRYPWWSVDSTSWFRTGSFGSIIMPYKRGGKFTYKKKPHVINISLDTPHQNLKDKHYLNLSSGQQAIVREWLDYIEVPLGDQTSVKEGGEPGCMNSYAHRNIACVRFYEWLRATIPEWPWPFRSSRNKGFGLI